MDSEGEKNRREHKSRQQGRNRNGSKLIIRLVNDLQAGKGYKGTT